MTNLAQHIHTSYVDISFVGKEMSGPWNWWQGPYSIVIGQGLDEPVLPERFFQGL